VAWGIAITLLGTVSALLGVLYALVDHDLKRLLAYHSVENIGIITIGLGVALIGVSIGNLPLASLALVAVLFHTINHGLFKGLLFLGSGVIAQTERTVNLEQLGGLWAHLVWTAPFFLIGCLSIAGLPPFNGFASEWMTFQSLIAGLAAGSLGLRLLIMFAIAGLALTSGLAVACFVKVFGVAFLGQRRHASPTPTQRERFDASSLSLGLLATLCVLLGVLPILAVVPLSGIVALTLHAAPLPLPSLPILPAALAIAPVCGAIVAVLLALTRGVGRVPTWTCGSPVTAAAQYTATAFSKPLRTVFAFMLLPERRRLIEFGISRWFPTNIRYRTESRYVVDEVARLIAARTLAFTRRSRVVQSGELRLYLAYATVAFIVVVVVAR
jgi:hydrogenase-4 component B